MGTRATACNRSAATSVFGDKYSIFFPDNLVWALCVSALLRQKPESLSPCHTVIPLKGAALTPDLICLCIVPKATERKQACVGG